MFKFFILLPLLPFVLNFFLRKEYTVHKEGIVLVTGASTGIGRHAAEALAASGYTVFAGVRKQSDADSIISSNIRNLRPIILDVTSHDSCLKSVTEIKDFIKSSKLPFVSLVNNAGVSRKNTLEFHDLDDARKVFDTNFFGMVDITQLYLPLLREYQGRVVMISSISGRIATPMSGIYSSSKFAMEAFSDSLRRELASHGVSVSIIEPGYVKSSIFASSDENSKLSDEKAQMSRDVYPKYFSEAHRAKRQSDLSLASEPTVTTNAIKDAISSRFPKTRYPVANAGGIPANVIILMQWLLPDRALDFFN